ncbi:hypothetical protein ACHAWF_017604 [Thalassiosira exigua]
MIWAADVADSFCNHGCYQFDSSQWQNHDYQDDARNPDHSVNTVREVASPTNRDPQPSTPSPSTPSPSPLAESEDKPSTPLRESPTPIDAAMPPNNITDDFSSGGDPIGVLPQKHLEATERHGKELMQIEQALPDSTPAERMRFLTDRRGDVEAAIGKLRNYLEWRKRHCDDDLAHLDPWTYATQLAIKSSGGAGNCTDVKLPCTVFTSKHCDNDDDSITMAKYIHHLPARIDATLADTSVYALAMAIYIDRALDRRSTEKIALVIDVRPGRGWANIKAVRLLPFIQSTARMLCDLHPTRLERCVVFPVPKVANFLWGAVKPFMGKETAKKVCLVSGSAGKDDGVPKKLCEYLDRELIRDFEDRRKSYFSR